jgi:HEAT repeat protein
MRKQVKPATILVSSASAIALAFWSLWPKEPSYHEKSLSAWLSEYNRAGAMDKTRPAEEAIRRMGEEALPHLIARLKAEDSAFKLRFLLLARKWHVHLFPAPRGEPRLLAPAILAFKALGRTASPCIPQLQRMFEVVKTRRAAGLALFSIGPASAPAFEQACGSTDVAVRIEAASFLARVPSSYNADQDYYCIWYRFDKWSPLQAYVAKPPSPDLIVNLAWRSKNHSNSNVRRACVEALASYYGTPQDAEPQIVVRALRKACGDPDALVRDSATAGLAKLGIKEKPLAETN